MGKYDDAMYSYLSDNDRFADLFNAVFFGGEKILNGDMLEPDSERYVDAGRMKRSERGFRDIKKRLKTGEGFMVMAIENQNDIDYTMPWRIMRYDQMEYGRQIEEIKRGKRAERKASGSPASDWTERLGPKDRLHPVYTICFYHGSEKWDGPRSLKDMMEFTSGTEVWKGHFHDYGMTLFCANEPADLTCFATELGQLLLVLPLRQDKEALFKMWSQDEFSRLDRETMETMAILTDSMEILDKLEEYEEEGGYNMCLAVEEMRRDCREEGKIEGKAEGIIVTCIDCGLSENVILEKLQDKLNVSLQKAKEYLYTYGK